MNKLAYWRTKRGLTVRALSEKSCVTPKGISQIEKGHTRPYLSTLGKLASALDMDASDLVEVTPLDSNHDGKFSIGREELKAVIAAFEKVGKEPEYDLEEIERWATEYIAASRTERTSA